MARGNIITEGKPGWEGGSKSDANVNVHTHVCLFVRATEKERCARRCSRRVSTGSRLESRANYPLPPSPCTLSLCLHLFLSLSRALSLSLTLSLSLSLFHSSRSANRPLAYLSTCLSPRSPSSSSSPLLLLLFFLLPFFWSMPSKKLIYHRTFV